MTILEVRSLIGLQSRCQQGSFLLELLGGNPFFSFSSFQKPLAFFNLCVCVCVCVCVCSVAQSCPIISDPMECSLPGSFCPWNFSGKNYWSGLPFPPPQDLFDPGIEPVSLIGRWILYTADTWEAHSLIYMAPNLQSLLQSHCACESISLSVVSNSLQPH